jgi:hypothetical protein
VAAFITIAASCVADKEAKAPPKPPMGVRTADKIKTSFILAPSKTEFITL